MGRALVRSVNEASFDILMVGAWSAVAVVAYASGGPKKTAEACTEDSECSRGHCYQKQNNDKVCVDCSASESSDFRGQVQRYCKDEPRGCTSIPQTEEAPEEYFNVRITNGDRCIAARDGENSRCWNSGDAGHKEALDVAEKARPNCYDELNTRKGNGGICHCSDSAYASRAADANSACNSYGRACADYSKDDKTVDCGKLEDAMKASNRCVETVERLDSDCLERLSRNRETQFKNAKNAYDSCKEILDYKKDKKLCN